MVGTRAPAAERRRPFLVAPGDKSHRIDPNALIWASFDLSVIAPFSQYCVEQYLEVVRELMLHPFGGTGIKVAPAEWGGVMPTSLSYSWQLSGGREMRALLVDDHASFIEGLRMLLGVMVPGIEADLAINLEQAGRHVESARYDLVLLDWALSSEVNGEDSIEFLREHGCEAPIVILSGISNRKTVEEAISLGAVGFIPKEYTSEMMIPALDQVLAGRIYLPEGASPEKAARGQTGTASYDARIAELTPRQLAVYMAATRGLSNKLIARELGIEASTVKSHLSAVYSILGVRNRTEAAYEASRVGRQFFPALRR